MVEVVDIQSWADNLATIKLPAIEADIAATDTLLTQKIQEFSDQFSTHGIQIASASDARVQLGSEILATATQLYDYYLGSLSYTDAAIQNLRDDLTTSITAAVTESQTDIQTGIDQAVVDAMLAAQTEVQTALVDAQTARDMAQGYAADITASVQGLLTETLPPLNAVLLGNQSDIALINNTLATFSAGISTPTILETLNSTVAASNTSMAAYVDGEVATVNQTISNTNSSIAAQIASEVATINQSITDSNSSVTSYVNGQIQLVNQTIAGLDVSTEGSIQDVVDNVLPDLITAEISSFYDGPSGQVKSTALNAYWTSAQTDQAITLSRTQLKAEIEDPLGTSLGATLTNNYFTKTDTNSAIAAAKLALKSEIEDPAGTSLGATLNNDYYTNTETDGQISSAVAAASLVLTSSIDTVSTNLSQNYYTSVETDGAIGAAVSAVSTTLSSDIGAVSTSLSQNYLTSAETEQAISLSSMQLKAEIEDPLGTSLGATLNSDYYTNTETDSQILVAVSSATTTLQSSIDSVSGNLTQNYYTSSETDNEISTAVAAAKLVLSSDIDNVSANLENNYYTSASTDNAISVAQALLKSEIENPNGSSLGATLDSDYYTAASTDSAIAAAQLAVKSEIEDPAGFSLGATLNNNYYTSTDVDGEISTAVAAASLALQSDIGNLSSTLTNNYYTTTETDGQISTAVSALSTTLAADIDDVASDLSLNYLTTAETNGAISTAVSAATQTLQSNIDDVSSTLATNYYTTAETDGAISTATSAINNTLQNNIDSVSANLTQNYYTSTETDGEITAAVTAATLALQSDVGTLSSTLANNYYTSTETDEEISTAVSASSLALSSDIAGVSSNLAQNYYTTSETDGAVSSAISAATQQLRSEINAENLVPDPTASSKDGWGNSLSSTISHVTHGASGTVSPTAIRVTMASTGGGGVYTPFASTELAGKAYRAKFKLRSNVPLASVGVQFVHRTELTGSDSWSTANVGAFIETTNTEFVEYIAEYTFAEDSTSNYLRLRVFDSSGNVSGDWFEITDVSIVDISDVANIAANLTNNYYTSTDTDSAITARLTAYTAELIAPTGAVGTIAADLSENYLTNAEIDSAISARLTTFSAELSDVGNPVGEVYSTLEENYYTSAQADAATAGYLASFESSLVGSEGAVGILSANLTNNYYTKVATDNVISTSISNYNATLLDPTGALGQLSANLTQNYYTSADTDGAITALRTELTSNIDQVSADLATNYYTSAATDTAIAGSLSQYTTNVLTPELTSLSGGIEELRTLDTNALSGTSIGTFLTQLEVGADGLSATVTNQGTAISNLEGFAAATATLTAETSNGQISGIRATSYDGEGGASSGSLLELLGDSVIAEGTISASRLVISDFSGNLVGNGSFVYGDARGWQSPLPGTASNTTFSDRKCLALTTSTTDVTVRWETDAPVTPGDQLSVRFFGAASSGGSATLRINVAFYRADGSYISGYWSLGATFNTTVWTEYNSAATTITVPNNTAVARFHIRRAAGGSGTGYITGIEAVRRRPGTTLITPNSITTNELNVSGDISTLGLTAAFANITGSLTAGQIPELPQSNITGLESSLSTLSTTRNRTFSQTTTPTATAVGDLWYNPSTDQFKRWSGSSWVSIAITADSVVAGWVYAGSLNASQITTGSLSADRIAIDDVTIDTVGGVLRVADSGVDTEQVSSYAITLTEYAYTPTLSVSLSGTAITRLATVLFNVRTGEVSITFSASICDADMAIDLYYAPSSYTFPTSSPPSSTATIIQENLRYNGDGTYSVGFAASQSISTTCPTGLIRFAIYGRRYDAGSSSTRAHSRYLKVQEFLR